ncbi:hypothetical protein BDV25DRAFT_150161 [Aspergillus avenaceus]|uniref:Glycosyltransferase family 31 protein n=1 Tax=Aspergillus avenaceus TaxID=36643 RepID=A0A5N6U397_ASPAV|nr:hypothetical protein BDV25DRAFT_150161 [Aspergillus avenaceus]
MSRHRVLRTRQPMKSFITIVFCLSAAIFLLNSRLRNSDRLTTTNYPTSHSKTPRCDVDLDLFRSYGYNESIEYERWDITVRQSQNFNGYSDHLGVPVPTFETIHLDTEHENLLHGVPCPPPVTIDAPVPVPQVDASHLVFGVSTSLERLDDSLDAFAHWAGGTNARIIAMVEPASPEARAWITHRARDLRIRLTMIDTEEELLDRYFHLTRIIVQARDQTTQWGVIIDDDTFFPSMSNLVDRLATYDASKPQYIGALSENFDQMGIFYYIAYGGAGIFLSMPLLEELDAVYDECYEFKDNGDKRVAQCIYMHTTTKLTWDRGLFQLDLQNDVSGFYESGRPLPLSLHHWKSWADVDVLALGKVAPICGDDCQLRRWRISDRWFLVNGFSLVEYSSPMDDLVSMEQTWDPSEWARDRGYAWSLGPLRPKDEGKVSFRLRSAIPDGKTLKQIYIQEPDENRPPRVLEVVWSVG